MIASKLLASSALALAVCGAASTAAADETAKPAAPAAKGATTTIEVKIYGRRQFPNAAIDVARLVPRAPLPELRQRLVDRIGKAVENDPF